METLVLLMIAPVAWPFIAKALWKHEITLGELALNILGGMVIAAAVWGIGRYVQTHDVEILNGKLVSKSRETVSCDHSYSCSCTTDSSGRQSCQTCYEHSNDYDWVLHSTVGDVKIERVDRQGSREPDRFTRARINDPVAYPHSFTNYVKAASNSLFHDKGAVTTTLPVPQYPNKLYDYHYAHRALSVGVPGVPLPAWDDAIAMSLRDLGAAKQVNFVILFANTADPNYAAAVERAWIGGKKNDVIVVFGITNYPEINWVRVLSWTDNQMFKVVLRDRLQDLRLLDKDQVINIMVEETKSKFARKHMKDFAYLSSDPPTWVLVLAFVLSIIGSVALSFYFGNNSVRTTSYRRSFR